MSDFLTLEVRLPYAILNLRFTDGKRSQEVFVPLLVLLWFQVGVNWVHLIFPPIDLVPGTVRQLVLGALVFVCLRLWWEAFN